jgi:hypothetical protein
MRNRRLPGSGLAAIALGLGALIGPGPATATHRPGAGATGNLRHAEWAWHHQDDEGW